jgi:hypothetical protein
VIVETTTLDIERGEPATSHIRAALAGGAHVVTANKGPVAFAYHRLARAAARAQRSFLFEGAVMDGVPIFNLVRRTLPAVNVLGFRGVVNSTTNFIITAMEQGQRFEDALSEMQARGVAEADASLDVDGWDAAAKTAALANVLLGANMTPRQVDRWAAVTARCAPDAAGRRLKLWARGARRRRSAPASRLNSSMATIAGGVGSYARNALILTTGPARGDRIAQRGAAHADRHALLSDLDRRRAGPAQQPPRGVSAAVAPRGRTLDERVADTVTGIVRKPSDRSV